uniref:Carotenoid 9,10(9',10')-cleavage dioxygenase 1-like n=1 Tax=Ananas comosus var. bracteatus TaxID=296719 RepID=A0A6V7QKF3_ANACO|nr:unnamed protein product [Ananas comosus var. bracteatus]
MSQSDLRHHDQGQKYTQVPSHFHTDPHNFISSLSSPFKTLLKEWEKLPLRIEVSNSMKTASLNLVDAFVDWVYKFSDLPALIEGNFAPVDEIDGVVLVHNLEGEIPKTFPEGVYIRNGPNPQYPTQTTVTSIFGSTAYTWYEGDGMLHATYFDKADNGKWRISYKNKYVVSETFQMEKERNKASFIPAVDGQPHGILAAFVFNMLRFGKAVKDSSNTSVFEHAGRAYAVTENHLPYEIDIATLDTVGLYNVYGAWNRPFTSHPKKAPRTGELVTMGVDVRKPHYVLGIISADGKDLLHKVNLEYESGKLIHEIGVTENYNIIMDYPLRFGIDRVLVGKQFIQHDTNARARIGVMPRFGDAKSTSWFDVKNHCSYHLINSFEEGHEVVVRGCRILWSVIPGPDHKTDKAKWLDLVTGEVEEGYITCEEVAMDFPAINNNFIGIRNKYAYTQVVDSLATSNSIAGLTKYKMLAKLHFDTKNEDDKNFINVDYHVLEENHFCSGVQFVEKKDAVDEDDGWLISYVHDEKANVSKVYIIDAKRFTEEPVAKITLPQRVPYGFHGIFISK